MTERDPQQTRRSGDPGRGEEASGYPAEKARQGHVVLRSRRRRLVFIGGLVGLLLLGLLLRLCAGPV